MICGVRGRRGARAAAAFAAAGAIASLLAACSTASVSASGGASPASHGAATPRGNSTSSPAAAPSASATAPSASATAPSRRPLVGKVIVLDPGHNGENFSHPATINRLVNVITEMKPCDTTGTETDAGYSEHAFTFNVAMRLARLLRAEGATVILTRTTITASAPVSPSGRRSATGRTRTRRSRSTPTAGRRAARVST